LGWRIDFVKSARQIDVAPAGYKSLEEISNKIILRPITQVIDHLEEDPEHPGKALVHPLEGIRSVRAARDRYRILYRVDPDRRMVSVLLVGKRKAGREDDVYILAQKLLKNLLG
jgi:mRNA interferase RelE/StbE